MRERAGSGPAVVVPRAHASADGAGEVDGTTRVDQLTEKTPKQLLHLVFGGELKSLEGTEFRDLSALDIIGVYPNYAEAYKAWRGAAQRTVDNAMLRYFIVHIHRLLDPEVTPHVDTATEG